MTTDHTPDPLDVMEDRARGLAALLIVAPEQRVELLGRLVSFDATAVTVAVVTAHVLEQTDQLLTADDPAEARAMLEARAAVAAATTPTGLAGMDTA